MTTMPGFGDTTCVASVGEQCGRPLCGSMSPSAANTFEKPFFASTTQDFDKDAGANRKLTLCIPGASTSSCAGCGAAICDSTFFRTSPGFDWHAHCLSCSVCHTRLDAQTSCYVRNGHTYCKLDYQRLFGRKCARCDVPIEQNEYVMLVKDMAFHTKCFACVCCNRPLSKGEYYALVGGASVYCQTDYEMLLQTGAPGAASGASCSAPAGPESASNDSNNNLDSRRGDKSGAASKKAAAGPGSGQKGRPRKRKDLSLAECASRSDVAMMALSLPTALPNGYPPTLCNHDGAHLAAFGDHANSAVHHCLSLITQSPTTSENSQKQLALSSGVRQKRMRTSFKHHQLRAMKAYFNLNHNPDARDLKQLSEKTGLSKRVLQVWFQNSRAKYRRSLLKQQQENGTRERDGAGHKRSLSQEQDEQSDVGSAGSREHPNLPINPMDAVDQILAQEKMLSHKGDDDEEEDDDLESSKDGSLFSNNYESLCSSSPAATRLNVPLACNQPALTMFGCEMQSRTFING